VAGWGDKATVRYVGVYWKTGKVFSEHWGFTWTFKLDGKTLGPGWQKGIHGMKVGGRRELRTPGALISGSDAAYVVALDKVKPGGS
jgi:peptidylprolyl isomerase